ncbi:hypothetical protein JCM10450v2_002393 [Rhodotorula kratochvilovae]
MPLPDVHPDGDPFAEQDKARAASSWLGRMEANALDEQHAQSSPSHAAQGPSRSNGNGFAPPRPAPVKRESSGGGAKGPKARQSLGTDSNGREILVVDSDDSDEDDDDHEPGAGDDDGSEGESGEGSGSEDDDGAGSDTPQVPGVDDEDEDDDDDDDSDDDSSSNASGPAGRAGEDVDMADGAAKVKSPKKAVGASEGGDATMQDGDAATDGAAGQPKKKRVPRVHSPTPPPLAPKERPTIRLSITLPPRKGVDVPEYNVRALAVQAGFLKEDEEPPKVDEESDAEGKGKEGDGADTPVGQGGENGAPPKKRRKRGPNVILGRFGGYDVDDPFVDDAEIELYEPRSFARPKRDGYFIQTGEVEVLARRGRVKGSKNKPKLDENGNPIPTAPSRRKSNKIVVGPDGKPIHPADAAPATEGGLPHNAGSPFPPKKVRKPGEFSKELQDDFDMLRREVENTVWEQKNKFPPDLKETLIGVAFHALRLDEYDDDFFAVMPDIFGYNLFTMKKLIKREVYTGRIADLTQQQDDLLEVIRKHIEEHYPAQRAEYLAKLEEWDKKQEQGIGRAPGVGAARRTPEPPGGRPPGFGHSPAIATPALGALEGAVDSPAVDKGDDEDKDSDEPKWRFRFNDYVRDALYKLGELEDKKSELTTEKQQYEKTKDKAEKPYSGKNARKQLYQRIVNLWPDNDVTTNQISREISNYKLKLKKAGLLPAEPTAAAANAA